MTVNMHHYPVSPWFQVTPDGVQVRLWLPQTQAVDRLYVRSTPDNEEVLTVMAKTQGPWAGQWWQALLPLDTASCVTRYCFKLITRQSQYWLGANGIQTWSPPEPEHFHYNPAFVLPEWVPAQVFYQIFPDRFANGNPGQSVTTDAYPFYNGRRRVMAKAWGEPVATRAEGTQASEFYGGDLAGIQSRLDYLQQLGVTALYLNPVFTSPSNHKYDTTDYYHVDPYLGGDQALVSLSDAVHQRGMRLILDAVFNHTSATHPWLNRFGDPADGGAFHDSGSDKRNWYVFDEKGDYAGWKGFSSLAVLDFANPAVQDYFYAGDDSVLRHWLRPPYNLDGWRFDVIHMLGDGAGATGNARHLRAMRQALKEENPQAYFLGEHFFEASRWLQGDQEDGAMNYYGFAHPLRAFLAGVDIAGDPIHLDGCQFGRWMTRALAAIPFANQLCQLNLLDSHDTPRFLTLLAEDRALMKLAVLMQMTWVGVPSIYYGDEIGLTGGPDPDCRRCFPWQESHWDQALLAHYRQLIAIRQQTPALQRGALAILHASGDGFAFARVLERELAIVAINRSPEQSLVLDLDLAPLGLGGQSLTGALKSGHYPVTDGKVQLNLAPKQGILLTAG